MRFASAIALLLIAQTVQALDRITLVASQIEAEGWKLKGIKLGLSGLASHPQRLSLSIQKLNLPKPLDQVDFVDVDCLDFSWGDGQLMCKHGNAKMTAADSKSQPVRFSFSIGQKRSEFHVSNLQLGDGRAAIDGEVTGRQWRLNGTANGVDSNFFKPYIASDIDLSQGTLSIDLRAEGIDAEPNSFAVNALLEKLTGQSQDGRRAAENATLGLSVRTQRERGVWQWLGRLEFRNGAVYIEPLYLEAPAGIIGLNAAGVWDGRLQRADIGYLSYSHPKIGEVTGYGTVGFKPEFTVKQGDLSLLTTDLKALSATYVQPFLTGSALEGVTLEGRLNAAISLVQQTLTRCSLEFSQLNVDDAKRRFRLKEGIGALHWSSDSDFSRVSELSWQQLQVYGVPVGPSTFSFLTKAQTVRLLEKTHLPFLDGFVTIDRFDWQAKPQSDPDVYFVGAVKQVSLEKLTEALNWTSLSGTVSGAIPGVDYRDKKLTLEGELLIKVFDGEIRIKDLASSGLFGDFPQVYSDITLDNLDLDQLTRKFKIGGIEGRLSGFVHDLYLENWRPVTFYAWLGTPEGDDSRHRISQKAVENLTSIGGGGATDLVSRTFLRLFDNFGYDRLGIGCYLHQGVCQLTGVEPAPQGYYIVKGGGLPRIDVIGYNPRIDWNVLLERLSRITATDEAVID